MFPLSFPLATAGPAPPNTPSSSCANCGKEGAPFESLYLCAHCKSLTYWICSDQCALEDAARHRSECKQRQKIMEKLEERRNLDETIDLMKMTREGKDLPIYEENSGARKILEKAIEFETSGEEEEYKKKSIADREDQNREALALRNAQLEHATEMYRKRHGLDYVAPPPHLNRCQKCSKQSSFGFHDKRFGQEMKRCSRCKSVRYCSAECQKADWKNHKKECRKPPA